MAFKRCEGTTGYNTQITEITANCQGPSLRGMLGKRSQRPRHAKSHTTLVPRATHTQATCGQSADRQPHRAPKAVRGA